MRQGWQAASLCFLAFFIFAIWQSLSYPLFDDLGFGPGFFPLWLSGIGAALSAILAFTVFRGTADLPDEQEMMPDGKALRRMLAVVILLAASALAIEDVGFCLTALAFTALLLLALDARSPIAIGTFSLCASFGVFYIFYHWLKVPLPVGILGV